MEQMGQRLNGAWRGGGSPLAEAFQQKQWGDWGSGVAKGLPASMVMGVWGCGGRTALDPGPALPSGVGIRAREKAESKDQVGFLSPSPTGPRGGGGCWGTARASR